DPESGPSRDRAAPGRAPRAPRELNGVEPPSRMATRSTPSSPTGSVRRVLFGIDSLLENPWPVAGKRVGLITNLSGTTSSGVPAWKALKSRSEEHTSELQSPYDLV